MPHTPHVTSTAPKICGIYSIYSARNGRRYVGHSDDILRRWRQHRAALRRGDKNCNPYLLNAWKKYGEDAFEFGILEECAVELLHIREQYHLDQHPIHYNCGECAESPYRGVRHTPEAKAKMSAAMMGNTNAAGYEHTDETKAMISAANTGHKNGVGRVVSPETRAKTRASMVGKQNAAGYVQSPETRENMRVAALSREERKRDARTAPGG